MVVFWLFWCLLWIWMLGSMWLCFCWCWWLCGICVRSCCWLSCCWLWLCEIWGWGVRRCVCMCCIFCGMICLDWLYFCWMNMCFLWWICGCVLCWSVDGFCCGILFGFGRSLLVFVGSFWFGCVWCWWWFFCVLVWLWNCCFCGF